MPSSCVNRRAKAIASSLLTCSMRSTQRKVQHLWNESGSDALDLMRPGLQRLAGTRLGQHRAGGRLHGNRDDRLALAVLDIARHAR